MHIFIAVIALACGMLIGGISGSIQGIAYDQSIPDIASQSVEIDNNGNIILKINTGKLQDIE